MLAWILTGWQSTCLALALDATSLGDRFTVLSISVVYRGHAIPPAWKVLHAKEHAEDWAWLVDHAVPIGQDKGLVILGIRLAARPPPGTALVASDLELIALVPPRPGPPRRSMRPCRRPWRRPESRE